ncbi:IS1380 family transposase [Modicisalibacter tunisiensis]|uniref:IS1380 family transposase n=1 Tax=Modicisalibacter tunisiensis TaxID=390637 RepID=A0ABS7WUS8_9GAMM|nr:IS1380 family transposase [Modicisalibacter tunisiensis]MBZ9538076.1 IS1380 family transposase [Modicisalibacter tunisiensis]MBZ9539099.1 IS1380 family transposase [Modicisalibacter tunisiensis]MBZ9539723.1 IS1380 family transposase [Modicisalibacter tunisiensis]MBZ9566360.1 IS1380 family transposase [Modicisalibacter tunisiensis]MBZ9566372.1 IS1380 family transposase [Modicisalibacter tunisiensis]
MFLAEHDSRGPLAMGETLTTWSPSCNGSVRVELDGQRTTSDSGALLLREALDNSGVIEALEDNLVDRRHPLRIRHSLASQLRTLVLQRAMGWIDLSDTDTLRRDPLWQLACSDARGMTPLAQERPSQATLSRLLTCLGRNDNIDAVHEGLLRLVVWRLTSLKNGERPEQLTLDIDGLPIEVHGYQGGSAFHGLYGARIYSPLVASLAETGDMVGGLLREGNAGPAENADTWIPHLVRRLNESLGARVRVRIDAGFTDNDTLEALEDRGIEYLGRLRSHSGLQKLAAPYLKRPRGRPPEQPREWCHDLEYQAGSWPAPRRVVLVVQERPDDLLLHAFFLVTNLGKFAWPPEKVLALYRKRGSAEAHMGEVKSALDVHLSSTDRGASTVQDVMARNEVSLLLNLYAYQVLHGLRRLLESRTHQGWSLSRMREQVLKVAATLSLHARRITVHLGDAADKWWPTLLKGLPRLTVLS